MSKTTRFINGITEKKILTLSNTSSFGGCLTKSTPSQCVVSEAVRLRIYAKKNPFDVHYVEGVVMLNLRNGNAFIIDDEGNKKLKTNMFSIKQDLASTMEEAREADKKHDKDAEEEAFIKCILLKYIYVHYAPLYANISPDVCGKVL